MDINSKQNITFKAFYRNSPPCQKYLSDNFSGNKIRFAKALEILDARCSKHKHFDMFYSPEKNSIKILSKNQRVENGLPPRLRYISIPEGKVFSMNIIPGKAPEPVIAVDNVKHNFVARIKEWFSSLVFKNKIMQNPYDALPLNVRNAVEIIEKMEQNL